MMSLIRSKVLGWFFLKKVSKIFGCFRNMVYLCTAFPLFRNGAMAIEVLKYF